MYASNMVLGMLFAKARKVRRKDIFLDGVLAGSVKSPAAAFVLVAALSPRQQRGSHAPTITGIDPNGSDTPAKKREKLTISGSNFGAVGSEVTVNFSYANNTKSAPAEGKVIAAATGASPTILVKSPALPGLATGSQVVTVSVTVGSQTSNGWPVTYR